MSAGCLDGGRFAFRHITRKMFKRMRDIAATKLLQSYPLINVNAFKIYII